MEITSQNIGQKNITKIYDQLIFWKAIIWVGKYTIRLLSLDHEGVFINCLFTDVNNYKNGKDSK